MSQQEIRAIDANRLLKAINEMEEHDILNYDNLVDLVGAMPTIPIPDIANIISKIRGRAKFYAELAEKHPDDKELCLKMTGCYVQAERFVLGTPPIGLEFMEFVDEMLAASGISDDAEDPYDK